MVPRSVSRSSPEFVIAHISDTHFDGGPVSEARAERVMAYLNGLPGHLDAIVPRPELRDYVARLLRLFGNAE